MVTEAALNRQLLPASDTLSPPKALSPQPPQHEESLPQTQMTNPTVSAPTWLRCYVQPLSMPRAAARGTGARGGQWPGGTDACSQGNSLRRRSRWVPLQRAQITFPFPATHPASHFCRTCQAGWGGLDLPAPLRMRFSGRRRRQDRRQGGREAAGRCARAGVEALRPEEAQGSSWVSPWTDGHAAARPEDGGSCQEGV